MKALQMSCSGYVARLIEKDMDDNYVVTKQDLDEWSKDLVMDPATGNPKSFTSTKELMNFLNNEADRINS